MRKITFIFLVFFVTITYAQKSKSEFEVFFDLDKSEATTNSLQKLSTWVLENKNVSITKILGYCDASGATEYNELLSLKRANYVQEILNKSGLKADSQIEIVGLGEKFATQKIASSERKVTIYFSEISEPKDSVVEESSLSKEINELKVGEKLKLKNLNFYNSSGVIVPKSKPVLDELLDALIVNKNLKIEIQGHICCKLKTDLDDISTVRARAIYNFLITNGIDKNRLQYKGFASSKPIYKIPEKNEFERDENRRVEIMILENQ